MPCCTTTASRSTCRRARSAAAWRRWRLRRRGDGPRKSADEPTHPVRPGARGLPDPLSEPTAAVMFRRDAVDLFDDADARLVRRRGSTGALAKHIYDMVSPKPAAPPDALARCARSAQMSRGVRGGSACAPRWPRKITLDGHKPSHLGLRRLRREDPRWKYVLVRNRPYLNNVVEQDHRAIKGRCRSMLGFKSYRTAALTLAGLELAHRIRKRQFKFGPGRWTFWSLKKQWDTALA